MGTAPLNPLSINDLAGLSKPLKKLITSVSKGLGSIYEPTQIRRIAEAKADAAIIQANSEQEVRIINWQTQERISYLELRRQKNINSIVGNALNQLPPRVNDQEIDNDWLVQFFNFCQDISNEQMQLLWSKLLAGEIASPGSFSNRTLSIIKLLSQDEAKIINSLHRFQWDNHFIYTSEKANEKFGNLGLNVTDVALLADIGLLQNELNLIISPKSKIKEKYFYREFILENDSDKKINLFHIHPITDIGKQIFSLCDSGPILEYCNFVVEELKRNGIIVTEIVEP